MPEHSPMFQTPAQESRGSWLSVIVGAVAIAIIVAAAVFFSKSPPPATQQALDKYAENLQVGSLAMSVAQNFVGASIHYVDGKIADAGGRTAGGSRAEVSLRNSRGQSALRETQNVARLEPASGDPPAQAVSWKNAPLQPNEMASFPLTFEHM